MNFLCLTLLLFVTFSTAYVDDSLVVKIKNGLIKGKFKTSQNGREFRAFEGIPYAEAPIGERRFKEPIPKKPWKGTWNATTTYTCMQMVHTPQNLKEPIGTEDCLYLNVYSPKLEQVTSALDVIVYIHGGAFMWGQPSYWGPELLLDHNVIYVNMNYRLGPLGFLSTQDDVLPGNSGLKDQSLALKWIKENIHYFGGNPESITITGLSAGGASVHFHFMSPLSKGLFKRGISISGNALNNWAVVKHPMQKTRKLGKIVGCDQQSSEQLVDCLRQRSSKQLVQAIKEFQPWLYNPYSPFGPVVEPRITTDKGKSFLTDVPYNLMKKGKIADVEWITSVTSEEGLYPAAEFLYKDSYLAELEENWKAYFPAIMHYQDTVAEDYLNVVSQNIRDYYLKGEVISRESYSQLVQAIGDRLFVVDAEKGARLQAQVNRAPVYFYKFSYRGDHSLSEFLSGTTQNLGASHVDDVMYVIKPERSWFVKYLESDGDIELSKILVNLWLTFAKTGKPQVNNIDWPRVSRNPNERIRFLHIISSKNIVVEDAEQLGHRTFWDSMPFKENNLIASTKTEL